MTDPVCSGQQFEAAMIFGVWDGAVTFVEPMVTRDLLISRWDFGGELDQPHRVAQPVSIPSAWGVSFDAATGVHLVTINGLVPRVPEDHCDETHTH